MQNLSLGMYELLQSWDYLHTYDSTTSFSKFSLFWSLVDQKYIVPKTILSPLKKQLYFESPCRKCSTHSSNASFHQWLLQFKANLFLVWRNKYYVGSMLLPELHTAKVLYSNAECVYFKEREFPTKWEIGNAYRGKSKHLERLTT